MVAPLRGALLRPGRGAPSPGRNSGNCLYVHGLRLPWLSSLLDVQAILRFTNEARGLRPGRSRPRRPRLYPACAAPRLRRAPSVRAILAPYLIGGVRSRGGESWSEAGLGSVIRVSGCTGRRAEAGSLVSEACWALDRSWRWSGPCCGPRSRSSPRSAPRQASEFLSDLGWEHQHWESQGERCLALFLGSRNGGRGSVLFEEHVEEGSLLLPGSLECRNLSERSEGSLALS